VVEGWKQFHGFPEKAINNFFSILQPVLIQPTDLNNRRRIESFCGDYGLEEKDVVVALSIGIIFIDLIDLQDGFCSRSL